MGVSCSYGIGTGNGKGVFRMADKMRKYNDRTSLASMVPNVVDSKLITKTIRIFLSSTFTDTTIDRNVLMEEVFEPIRVMCRQHGVAFEIVDLRWGVRRESVTDHRTLNICLEEVKRCQETSLGIAFIAILGDKYGWRPLPPTIPSNDFLKFQEHLDDSGRALLNKWYLHDDNAVPASYTLQPINKEFDVQSPNAETHEKAMEEWTKVEQKIRSFLYSAIEKADLSDNKRRHYLGSVTEREVEVGIIELEHDEATKTTMAIDRRFENIDVKSENAKLYINFQGNEADEDSRKHLKKLKDEELSPKLGPDRFFPFHNLKWDNEGISMDIHGDYIKEMCEKVKSLLETNVRRVLSQIGPIDKLEEEITRHALFCREHTINFVGRASILSKIHKHIDGEDPMMPLVIYGESGVGKTALVSKVVRDVQNRYLGSDLAIIYRFCGTSADSSSGRGLMLSLCRQIARIYGANEESIPQTYSELIEEFIKLLNKANADVPLFILIDSLDQLSDENSARQFLEWLPRTIPNYVRLIVSTLPDVGGCLDRLKTFGLPTSHFIQINRLDKDDGPAILDGKLKNIGRTLTPKQRNVILTAFKNCSLPLYLELAFQQCRDWASYKDISECKLEADVDGMVNSFYESLERYHGKLLVSRVLGLISASVEGINPDEFLDILSCDDELLDDVLVWHEPPQKRLPPLLLARLRHDLGSFLVERGSQGSILVSLYHRQFWEVAQRRYLSGDAWKETHSKIARYFSGSFHNEFKNRSIRAQPLAYSKESLNIRKISQLLSNHIAAQEFDKLRDVICNLKFVQAKCMADMAYDLLSECTRAVAEVRRLNEDVKQLDLGIVKDLEEMLEFLRRETYIISKTPLLVYQQTQNAPKGTAPEKAATKLKEQFTADVEPYITKPTGWIEYMNKPSECEAYKQQLSGHQNTVLSVSFSKDGNSIYSASVDKTVRVWNRHTGDLKGQLEGHNGAVTCVRFSPTEEDVATSSGDLSIHLWDPKTYQQRRVIENAHKMWINCISYSPDGKKLISSSLDKKLKIWDVASGHMKSELIGHEGHVIFCDWSPIDDNKVASCGDNLELYIWDVKKRSTMLTLVGHKIKDNVNFPASDRLEGHKILDYKSAIWCVRFSHNGKMLASAAVDSSAIVYNAITGDQMARFRLPNDASSVAFSPDDQLLVASSSSHMSVHLYNIIKKENLALLGGHSGWVMDVTMSPDSKLIASVSQDKSIRIWDAAAAEKLTRLRFHSERCWSVSYSPDGKWLASSSDDFKVCVWNMEKYEPSLIYEGHDRKRTFSCGVRACTFSNSSELVASGGDDLTIRVWTRDKGETKVTIRCQPFLAWCLRFSKDDKRIIGVGEFAQSVLIYDWESQTKLMELGGFDRFCQYTEFSPDGGRIIGSSIDHTARIFSSEDGALIQTMEQPAWITCASFSHDQKHIVTCSDDLLVRIWNSETNTIIGTMSGHISEIRIVCFSPDDKYIASAALDQTIRIWDVEQQKQIHVFHTASGVWALAWNPIDTTLLTAGDAVGYVYFLKIRDIK